MTRGRDLALAAGAAVAGRAVLGRLRALDLEGRTALVTGGSRGLGLAIAEELGARGAKVSICGRGSEALERARSRLAGAGVEAHARSCDVADRDAVAAWVREAEAALGPVDVLVNNAGVISVGPFRAQRPEDFEEALAIMFWGVLNPTLAVLPGMVERGEGTIANITSIGGKVAVPHLGSYTAAKFAAVGLSEGMRAELAKDGVRVVTVVPGLMRTGSYVAAVFKGDPAKEYALFGPSASSPFNTLSARRAAKRIVRAIRTGRAEVTLGLHAKLLARANGVAPGLVADALGLVNRALPADPTPERVRGREIDSFVDETPLTALGRRAQRKLNQTPV